MTLWRPLVIKCACNLACGSYRMLSLRIPRSLYPKFTVAHHHDTSFSKLCAHLKRSASSVLTSKNASVIESAVFVLTEDSRGSHFLSRCGLRLNSKSRTAVLAVTFPCPIKGTSRVYLLRLRCKLQSCSAPRKPHGIACNTARRRCTSCQFSWKPAFDPSSWGDPHTAGYSSGSCLCCQYSTPN